MNLTKGRKEPCKNNAGGIKELYLSTYVDYSVRQIVGYREQFITSFPDTQVYRYEGQNITFDENINEDGSYSQNINLRLIKQDLATAQLLSILIKNKVRAVIVDYLGGIRVAGCVNGLDAEIKTNTGGSRVDFNGYDLTLNGSEEFQAPFIADLENSGLTSRRLDFECLLASSDKPASLSNKVADCNVVI